ncbi:MAG: ABC transporter ATP-binding protein [Acidobacteria bacterium]|nr:ABC transporter ATP-binding protein [Acidobacteriota bacterium]
MEQIRFDHVTQRFRLIRERPDTLREVFARMLHKRPRYLPFEAIKDISFSVKKGETVGIVGRNGSGKSTTLKIIAGIYSPTTGKVSVNGKVAALVELGAGFSPDLTGRENIFINGLLLKMTRREIRERERRIIEFSELGEFIDSPIKQYSSGMYMRLAFSIAVERDPDILLVDEILAVGDAGFREKSMERIMDFHRRGKTIVFVSHAMTSVKQLCTRAILLHKGKMVADGTPGLIYEKYEAILKQAGENI